MDCAAIKMSRHGGQMKCLVSGLWGIKMGAEGKEREADKKQIKIYDVYITTSHKHCKH